MSDDDIKQAYWRELRFITAFAVFLLLTLIVVLPVFAPQLNAYRFLRFPLGYFLMANAAVVLIGFIVYGFFAAQARADRAHNMTIQF